jgi:putative tricarboxylic transport membrane protein
MLENLAMGFKTSLSLYNVIVCFLGCTLGTIIGVLPGLGPTATIAMLLSLTYKFDISSAIIMLSGIYYGAQYGGTITSVLLNIPGEASSVVTTIDGYQMALQGRSGKALGIAAFGSFIAGTLGTVGLSLLAPPLSRLALVFGPPEYTALMLLGMTLVIYLGGRQSVTKALLMGALGLALGTVGMDQSTAIERFTFGSQSLIEGINLAILAMGLFGIGEILFLAEDVAARSSREALKSPQKFKELLPDRRDWKTSMIPIGRGTLIGFLLGILPGGGATIASFASYAVEKIFSKNREKFGTGAIEGVAGPESANNSAVSGGFIPLLTLGIPSNSAMAVLMAAFMLHGVIPGPLLLKEHPQLFWAVLTSMYIGNIILLILNVPLIRVFVKIIEIPFGVISPLIAMICVVGAYSINNNPVDVISMMIFGVFGYLMRKFNYPLAPLILAFVVGPLFEKSLCQSLTISGGNPSIFFSRPISLVLAGTTLFVIVSHFVITALQHRRISLVHKQIRESKSQED